MHLIPQELILFIGHITEDIKFVFNTFGFRIKGKMTTDHPPSPCGRGSGGGEEIPYYKLGLYNHYPFAPVLTSMGCPYNCAYCGSKILNDGFFQRDVQSVIEEIKELCNKGIKEFAFYDDALFVNADSHIKIILKRIIAAGLNIRFHCPNGLHARFIDDELASLMKNSGFKTLRLSLETVDEQRQKETGGKVSNEDLINAINALKRNGFTKNDIGVYLMYGLPGQSLEEVKDGVEFLKGLNVRINLTEFSPIPKTRYWNELLNKGIINDNIDPLLTNNTVFSYLFSEYGEDELKQLKFDVKEYNIS